MTTALLPCVELDPPTPHRSSVLWLHGLGADGNDFVPIVPHLGLDPDLGVRFVFPHAPSIPVTLNQGFVMPAWYDIEDLDLGRKHDEAGILLSCERVRALIAAERERGIPSERIVLAGFSQGGAIALHEGIRHPETLAGILALSTYALRSETTSTEASEANRSTPIFQGHGTMDPMVEMGRGVQAREHLRKHGWDVEWHEYPMMHEVSMEEIRDVGAWLADRLGS